MIARATQAARPLIEGFFNPAEAIAFINYFSEILDKSRCLTENKNYERI